MTMTIHPENAPPAQFHAVLTPHRSLSRLGFYALMAAVSIVCIGTGIFFATLGAWPILGFCGLDIVLVYWAFRSNYLAARAREVIELADHQLAVTKISPMGRQQRFTFNPAWVRLELRETAGDVCELSLTERGSRLVIAGFLGNEERRDFARSLRSALAVR
jgi:uncharacterized membrane protein